MNFFRSNALLLAAVVLGTSWASRAAPVDAGPAQALRPDRIDSMSTDDAFGESIGGDGASKAAAAVAGAPAPALLGAGHELVATQPGDGRVGDLFGSAYDVDGDTLVVGAHRDDVGLRQQVGSVYVYTRVAGQWQLLQKITHPSPATSNQFGYSVAVSGDSLIIGAPAASGFDRSAVFIYTRVGSTWTLAESMANQGVFFGTTVDIAGSFAYATNGGNGSDCGATCPSIVVGRRVGGNWTLGAPLPAPDTSVPYVSHRAAIAADGTLIVGANAVAPNGDHIVAHVLRIESGAVVPVQRLTVPASAAQTLGGAPSVAVTGDGGSVAIGMSEAGFADRPSTGAVFTWRRNGTAWTPMSTAVDAPPAGRTSHGFGGSIAFDGDRLAVTFFEGAVGEPPSVDLAAGVRAFTRNGSTWLSTNRTVRNDPLTNPYGPLALNAQHLLALGNARSPAFLDRAHPVIREFSAPHAGGTVVASAFNPPGMRGFQYGRTMASSGSLLLVGAPNAATGYDSGRGAVYVYQRGVGAPMLVATLVAPNGHPDDAFGTAIAADGDVVLVGAPWQRVGSSAARGAAHVFDRQGHTLVYRGMLSQPQTDATAGFGRAIALQGDRAVVASDGPSAVGTGRIDYYVRDGAGVFQPIAFRANASPGEPGQFGASLAVDGPRIAVGHSRVDHPSSTPASVSLFTGTATALQPEATLTSTLAGFASSIALAGDRLIVGASGFPSTAGRIVPYLRSGGTWQAQAEVVDPEGDVLSRFGATVIRIGDFVYVGAPTVGPMPGAVYRYLDAVPANPMTFVQTLHGRRQRTVDFFGTAVTGSTDGVVFVSSPQVGGVGDFDNPDDGAVFEFGDFLLLDGFE